MVRKRVKTSDCFALIGVLCVAFVWWRLFTTDPGTAADLHVDFQNYVFELMEEY